MRCCDGHHKFAVFDLLRQLQQGFRNDMSPEGRVMKLLRRQFLHLAAGAAALPTVLRFAWAQAYPTRPMTMIVPFAAGGPQDVLGRLMAQRMSEILGKQIVVENIG